MTQEEKQLLLADICARLPYGVNIKLNDETVNRIYTLNCYDESDYYDDGYKFDAHSGGLTVYGLKNEDFKPYLRPMSSMTEEEYQEFGYDVLRYTPREFDWLNAHHFDYRRLIEKGLALEASKEMYEENC